ncbi:MAG: hypothetical protein ACKOPG_08455 [Novosphingobium sp.]
MTDLDAELERERRSLSGGARMAIGCAIVLGVPILLLAGYGIYVAFIQTPAQRMEALLERSPQIARVVAPVKRAYPAEFDRLVERIDGSRAMNKDEDIVLPIVADFMAKLWGRHRQQMTQAPDAQVLAVIRAQARMAEIGTKNAKVCHLLFKDVPIKDWDFLKEKPTRDAVYAMAQSIADAAAAGREHPVDRILPSEADKLAMGRGLGGRGLTDARIQQLKQPNLPDEALEANCKTLDLIYETLLGQPTERLQRLGTQAMRDGGTES